MLPSSPSYQSERVPGAVIGDAQRFRHEYLRSRGNRAGQRNFVVLAVAVGVLVAERGEYGDQLVPIRGHLHFHRVQPLLVDDHARAGQRLLALGRLSDEADHVALCVVQLRALNRLEALEEFAVVGHQRQHVIHAGQLTGGEIQRPLVGGKAANDQIRQLVGREHQRLALVPDGIVHALNLKANAGFLLQAHQRPHVGVRVGRVGFGDDELQGNRLVRDRIALQIHVGQRGHDADQHQNAGQSQREQRFLHGIPSPILFRSRLPARIGGPERPALHPIIETFPSPHNQCFLSFVEKTCHSGRKSTADSANLIKAMDFSQHVLLRGHRKSEGNAALRLFVFHPRFIPPPCPAPSSRSGGWIRSWKSP